MEPVIYRIVHIDLGLGTVKEHMCRPLGTPYLGNQTHEATYWYDTKPQHVFDDSQKFAHLQGHVL